MVSSGSRGSAKTSAAQQQHVQYGSALDAGDLHSIREGDKDEPMLYHPDQLDLSRQTCRRASLALVVFIAVIAAAVGGTVYAVVRHHNNDDSNNGSGSHGGREPHWLQHAVAYDARQKNVPAGATTVACSPIVTSMRNASTLFDVLLANETASSLAFDTDGLLDSARFQPLFQYVVPEDSSLRVNVTVGAVKAAGFGFGQIVHLSPAESMAFVAFIAAHREASTGRLLRWQLLSDPALLHWPIDAFNKQQQQQPPQKPSSSRQGKGDDEWFGGSDTNRIACFDFGRSGDVASPPGMDLTQGQYLVITNATALMATSSPAPTSCPLLQRFDAGANPIPRLDDVLRAGGASSNHNNKNVSDRRRVELRGVTVANWGTAAAYADNNVQWLVDGPSQRLVWQRPPLASAATITETAPGLGYSWANASGAISDISSPPCTWNFLRPYESVVAELAATKRFAWIGKYRIVAWRDPAHPSSTALIPVNGSGTNQNAAGGNSYSSLDDVDVYLGQRSDDVEQEGLRDATVTATLQLYGSLQKHRQEEEEVGDEVITVLRGVSYVSASSSASLGATGSSTWLPAASAQIHEHPFAPTAALAARFTSETGCTGTAAFSEWWTPPMGSLSSSSNAGDAAEGGMLSQTSGTAATTSRRQQ